MAIIRVSILVDIDTTDTDIEGLRADILYKVARDVSFDPDLFLLTPLDLDDEADWEEFNEHTTLHLEEDEEDPVHPSFDPVFKNER
jgi:hypothetical protein